MDDPNQNDESKDLQRDWTSDPEKMPELEISETMKEQNVALGFITKGLGGAPGADGPPGGNTGGEPGAPGIPGS